jgi:hypothetical protein
VERVRFVKGGSWSAILLMGMLVVFPWIVVGIIANLHLAQMTVWQSGNSVTEPVGKSSTTSQMSALEYGSSSSSGHELAAVFALAVLASIVIWRIQKRRTKREEWYANESPKTSRVALLMAVGLIVFIFYGLVMLERNLPNLLYAPSPLPDISRFLIPLTVSLILACSALGLFLFLRTRESSQVQVNVSESGLPEEARKVASVLDTTIYALKSGKGYRDTVINCYRALCAILESGGVPNDSSLTAREFEILAAKMLGRWSEYLHQATFLFEKARYSDDSVSEEEARRSIVSLEKLRDWVTQEARPKETLAVIP